MMLENNWRSKTLENLEKDVWTDCDHESRLVKKIHALRKIPLNSFKVEDLRVMIGQGFSLDYMIPIALEVLKNNLFVEGDLYKGDLLQSILAVPNDFWRNNKEYWLQVGGMIEENAEKGRFHSMDELRAEIENWKNRYSNE